MVKQTLFKNLDAYKLENEYICVVVIPKHGSRIASIYSKSKKFETVYQPTADELLVPDKNSSFSDFIWGIDDAFPSLYCGTLSLNGKIIAYPADHGEVWTLCFHSKIEEDGLVVFAKSNAYNYEITKKYILNGSKLRIDYRIINCSESILPCLYTFHGLFKCEKDMQILFPAEVSEVENAKIFSKNLGKQGTLHPYPITKTIYNTQYRLDRIPGDGVENTEKYYSSTPVTNGHCELMYPSANVSVQIAYDSEKLPYLGFYVSEGLYGYNCAFEPSSSYYDRIEMADKNGTLLEIRKDEAFEFYIEIALKTDSV